MTIFDHDI